ncbi:nitroreductase [Microbacterium sp. dk485]|uniref:nitroreductase family protein n=1 Tax=Microbacterium sp. dk485 TaxID=2560021 RepID=UPI00107372F7|nr:nitroreductase family protein [Microbacterium sp. dk485]TFV80881.1 nitroreductase [Microbacterium sp. dk485]
MTLPEPSPHAAEASAGTPERGGSALDAVRARRSWSRVTDEAPTRSELEALVSAAGRVADHSSLRPWRLIELRGADRERLGRAIHKALGQEGSSTKPLRAPLLVAIVVSYRKSEKVPRWEQEAVAAGVAHTLSLLLDEAGWGVIWRTGHYTRSKAVAKAHGLGKDEALLGWLYVGGKPDTERGGPRKGVDAAAHLSRMPEKRGRGSKKNAGGGAKDESTAL